MFIKCVIIQEMSASKFLNSYVGKSKYVTVFSFKIHFSHLNSNRKLTVDKVTLPSILGRKFL